jgi:hypothetical protein
MPLQQRLVFMLLCLKFYVVLLVQIEELFPVAARKVVPLAGSGQQRSFFPLIPLNLPGIRKVSDLTSSLRVQYGWTISGSAGYGENWA